jgi:leucyl aminopeptidase
MTKRLCSTFLASCPFLLGSFLSILKLVNYKKEYLVKYFKQGEELKEKGFGGIYGVGKAAEHKPALVVLSHKPEGATKTIAWVGKGIVYDTGGLSIKVVDLVTREY